MFKQILILSLYIGFILNFVSIYIPAIKELVIFIILDQFH